MSGLPALRRILLAASSLAMAIWLARVGSSAASCAPLETPNQALLNAPIAFVGTVIATASQDRTATIHVEEIWKGPNLSDPVEVIGGPEANTSTSVDRTWQTGQRYLVFPIADSTGALHDNACSATSVYKPEFDLLRPAGAHPPQGPPTSGPPGATPIAAVFLAILILGSAGAFVLWRSGRSVSQAR